MDPFTIALIVGALTTGTQVGFSFWNADAQRKAQAKAIKQQSLASAKTTAVVGTFVKNSVIALVVGMVLFETLHVAF